VQYLGEKEFGYDKDRLGFPSISACRAIVFQTTTGLFGYHNAGNNYPERGDWTRAAEQFAGYVVRHPENGAGVRLFVVTRVGNGGAYFQLKGSKRTNHDMWVEEAKTFAKALQFNVGPIVGFDLSTVAKSNSSYVEFRRVFTQCLVIVKDWDFADDVKNEATKGNYVDTPDHVMSVFGKGNMPAKVYDKVGTTAATDVTLETLRA